MFPGPEQGIRDFAERKRGKISLPLRGTPEITLAHKNRKLFPEKGNLFETDCEKVQP